MGMGVPKEGLWLREDVDMKCNFAATSFVKKTLKKAHATLVNRLVEKAHIVETDLHNNRLEHNSIMSYYSDPRSPGMGSPGMGSPGMGSPGMGSPGMGSPVPTPEATHRASYFTPPDPHNPSAQQHTEHRASLGSTPYPYSPPAMAYPAMNPKYSQPPPDPRYTQIPRDRTSSQSSSEARYSQQSRDPRISRQPDPNQAPRQTYKTSPTQPMELPPSEPKIAELDAFSVQRSGA